jgi:tRNA U34 5-carboxymethylaminomethyl modifying GTPase MnmE/TrmE
MMNNDIISAISTPQGNGAIAIVRLSGNESIALVDKLYVSPKEGKSLIDSVRFASKAAAISISRHGAIPSVPRRDELMG